MAEPIHWSKLRNQLCVKETRCLKPFQMTRYTEIGTGEEISNIIASFRNSSLRWTCDAEIRASYGNTISRNEFPSKRYCAPPPKRYHHRYRHLCPRVLNRENFGGQMRLHLFSPRGFHARIWGRIFMAIFVWSTRGAHYPRRDPPINRREAGFEPLIRVQRFRASGSRRNVIKLPEFAILNSRPEF